MIDAIDTIYYVVGEYICEININGTCNIYNRVTDKYWC